MDEAQKPAPGVVPSLILCPTCNVEMRLFGIEVKSDVWDLFTFDCMDCGRLETRGVPVVPSR